MMVDDRLYDAGLVLCLTWNVVAVTAAWIKGEGQFRNGLSNGLKYKSDSTDSMDV